MPEDLARLADIAQRLEAAAERLREDSLEAEEATRIAGECAELAAEAAAEVERLARSSSPEVPPGQEELL
jgi:hypothetical protein